ncbi:NTP transferase domain-containing protein [Rhizohabitans arisaemae]|uniref:NTP transferase domain-containing protein n=1 Tax=Rhizohabitans arisaemae TaxID=2720610 RepID=UPI0024B0FB47|nr:NTP transferase domain-containing protein [Rhizohabitans arisaemae]
MEGPQGPARRPDVTVVLATGEGVDVRTEVCGRSLIRHTLDTVAAPGLPPVVVLVSDPGVVDHIRASHPQAGFADPRGEGGLSGGVRRGLANLGRDDAAGAVRAESLVALVVDPVAPLPTRPGLERLAERHAASDGAVSTLATGDGHLPVAGVLDLAALPDAATPPDLAGLVKAATVQGPVGAGAVAEPEWALRADDPVELAEIRRVIRDRIVRRWMRAGVVVVDPATTWIDAEVVLEPGVRILRNVELSGSTRVGADCVLGPDTTLADTVVGPGSRVRHSVCERAELGPGNNVGPYSYLRPGTRTAAGVTMGSFVHIKETELGEGTMVPHFAFLGDGVIGARCNISGFTGFVNWDGVRKHRTVLGDDVLLGAGSAVVAPVVVGAGAFTAAGTIVTKDVPPGALALTRVRQEHIEGWAETTMPGSHAAESARRARARDAAAREAGGDAGREER